VVPLLLQRNIMGEWFRLDHATGIAMTASDHAKGAPFEVLENLHGGEKGDQGEHHYQYHQGRIYNNLTVVMFMLKDVNPGDGGLTVIPGSHKSNHPWPDEVYPHTQLAQSHLVHQPSLKAGDMLIFSEALIHGTTYWTGAQDRRLVSFKFCPGHVQYINPSNPSSSHNLLPYATSDLQRQLLENAWVGRPKVKFPPGVGECPSVTTPSS
jgi:ectoine hydroxylase-related dioxygenase (phytanoyl-CoA dioxygenase family)